MTGHSGVDEYIGVEGIHYRVSRPALIAVTSSSARCAVSPGPSGSGSLAAWVSSSRIRPASSSAASAGCGTR